MGSTYLGLRSNDLERRVRLLAAGGGAQSEPERLRLSALIQELNSAIASLRIGDDLLRQQNDELDVALARAERERRSHYTLFEFAPTRAGWSSRSTARRPWCWRASVTS